MFRGRIAAVFSVLLIIIATGCGGEDSRLNSAGVNQVGEQADLYQQHSSWPVGLPADVAQPWEQPDGDGIVMPVADAGRSAGSLNSATEFAAGIERYLEGGAVADNGEASSLASAPGSLSYAIYRIPLGGDVPGVVSIDVNTTAGAGYYVGLADYGSDTWAWHGPFSDNHVRLGTAAAAGNGADFTSSSGSVFVCVTAWDGAACDIVGVGVNPVDPADTTAPAVPAGLSLTAVNNGLLVEWLPNTDTDLAGYHVYHHTQVFADGQSTGVEVVPYIAVQNSLLLQGVDVETFLRVSAVDISGNESVLSDIESAIPLPGPGGELIVQVSAPSGAVGETVSVTATGSDSYEFDTDGDGISDIIGDVSGVANVDTTFPGIIRVGAAGTSGGGMSYAQGGVSVIVSSNSRPVAVAAVTQTAGETPLDVTFTGADSTDFDGSIVGGGWDFDGDGTYDVWDDTDIVHVTSADHTYNTPGVFNARLRVVDDLGSWDVDTIVIVISGEDYSQPRGQITASPPDGNKGDTFYFDASGSRASAGETITQYVWDLDGNGSFETNTDAVPHVQGVQNEAGEHTVSVRITDSAALQAIGELELVIHGWSTPVVIDNELGSGIETILINGRPAIWYTRSSDIYFALADDPRGRQWGTPIMFASGYSQGFGRGFAMVNGMPACSVHDSSLDDLIFVRAADDLGQTWNAPLTVDSTGEVGIMSDLAVIGGRPAIAYLLDTDYDLLYVRADDEDGGTWGSPVSVVSTGDVGSAASMIMVNGRPAIAYDDFTDDLLRYVRADDSTGLTWGTPVDADGSAPNVGEITMLIVNGHPAIAYNRNPNTRYVRALDENGTAWGTPVEFDIGSNYVSMAIIDGRPAICSYDSSGPAIYVIQANDVDGVSWASPQIAFGSGLRNALVDSAGMPGVIFSEIPEQNVAFTRKY